MRLLTALRRAVVMVGIGPFVASVAGCTTPVDELLTITFGTGSAAPPIEVDTLCGNGGCNAAAEVEATVAFEDDGTVGDDASVEFSQYRIDYDIGGFRFHQVPYYAGATSVLVPVGGDASFIVRVAGDRQRDFFTSRLGSGEANGVATLTLAGYDDADDIIMVAADFDIAFGDFVVDGGGPDDGSDGGGS